MARPSRGKRHLRLAARHRPGSASGALVERALAERDAAQAGGEHRYVHRRRPPTHCELARARRGRRRGGQAPRATRRARAVAAHAAVAPGRPQPAALVSPARGVAHAARAAQQAGRRAGRRGHVRQQQPVSAWHRGLGPGLVEQRPHHALPAPKLAAQLVSDIRRRSSEHTRRQQSRGACLSARFSARLGGRRLDRGDRRVEVERVVVLSAIRT